MFSRSRFLAFALAVLATFAFVGAADAGWVTIKNNTDKSVVVQEFVIVNGKKVTGRPIKMLSGESFREFQNTPGIKNYEILDAANAPVGGGRLDCRGDSQSFSIITVQGKFGFIQVPEAKKP
jgi:hypothetical protein